MQEGWGGGGGGGWVGVEEGGITHQSKCSFYAYGFLGLQTNLLCFLLLLLELRRFSSFKLSCKDTDHPKNGAETENRCKR